MTCYTYDHKFKKIVLVYVDSDSIVNHYELILTS